MIPRINKINDAHGVSKKKDWIDRREMGPVNAFMMQYGLTRHERLHLRPWTFNGEFEMVNQELGAVEGKASECRGFELFDIT